MKCFSILLTMIFTYCSVYAQSPEDSVKLVINQLSEAMRSADAVKLKAVFSDSAILQTIIPDKVTGNVVKNEVIRDFADFISKLSSGDVDERVSFETIKFDGPLAFAWTPYNFYYKGKFSHCG